MSSIPRWSGFGLTEFIAWIMYSTGASPRYVGKQALAAPPAAGLNPASADMRAMPPRMLARPRLGRPCLGMAMATGLGMDVPSGTRVTLRWFDRWTYDIGSTGPNQAVILCM